MLTSRDLETLRAALLFWREEMCPHSPTFVKPYFDRPDVEPLSTVEIEQLRERLHPEMLRYALCDAKANRLLSVALYTADEAVSLRKRGDRVVTVFADGS